MPMSGNSSCELDRCFEKYRDSLFDREIPPGYCKCSLTDVYSSGFERHFFYNPDKGAHNCPVIRDRIQAAMTKEESDGQVLEEEKDALSRHCFGLIVFFDLVAFKAINDRFSHSMGNCFLREFASLCQKHRDELMHELNSTGHKEKVSFHLFRNGGDEFHLLGMQNPSICDEQSKAGINFDIYLDYLEQWAKEVEKDWLQTKWTVYDANTKGPTDKTVDSRHIHIERYTATGCESKSGYLRYLIQGLKVRAGAGLNEKDAEDRAKRDEENDERGVINPEFMIYCHDMEDAGLSPDQAPGDHWRSLKENIVYVLDADIFCDQALDNLRKEILSALQIRFTALDSLEEDIVTWKQDGALFIAVPIGYQKSNEDVLSKLESSNIQLPLKHISWIDYSEAVKNTLAPIMRKRDAFYLNRAEVK